MPIGILSDNSLYKEVKIMQGNKLNLKILEVAEKLEKSQQYVRVGLQRGILPFGSAVKMSSKWTYHISANKFYEYMGTKGVKEWKK